MSESGAAITPDYTEFLQELSRWYIETIVPSTVTHKWGRDWCSIENLAQDQVIIRIGRGSRIDTYRGLHVRTDEDSQSDYTYGTSIQLRSEKVDGFIADLVERYPYREFEPEESFSVVELRGSVAVEERGDVQSVDITADDVSQWASDQLVSALMDTKAESDMPRLREMILIAEDTGFSVEESERLAPWLLSFAQRYRDSSDPEDEAAVWSAIRTGASMLRPQAANLLFPLLEPGHSIETSLVTVKMLGRIFEAQPPARVDEYQGLANEVYQMADFLLNRYAITSSQNAAMGQLAIYALAAMASSEIHGIVKSVQRLDIAWFTQQTLRELRELGNIWANRSVAVAKQPRKLLDETIQMLVHH